MYVLAGHYVKICLWIQEGLSASALRAEADFSDLTDVPLDSVFLSLSSVLCVFFCLLLVSVSNPVQVRGRDSVLSDSRQESFPVFRRARLQSHLQRDAETRRLLPVRLQHARPVVQPGCGRLADQPILQDASHVHLLRGLGRV